MDNHSITNIRYYGLDLYRLLLACMVVFIHVCTNSGGQALKGAELNTYSFMLIQGGFTFAIAAVNGYALLSGFLGYGRKHSPTKVILMWLSLLFYSVFEYLIISIYYDEFSIKSFSMSLFPVCNGSWWYINIYLLLILFMPLIDKAIDSLNYKRWLFIVTCVIGAITISNGLLGKKDIFYVYNGYSLGWLTLLYFVGAGAKKFRIADKFKNITWFFIWLTSGILTNLCSRIENFIQFEGIDIDFYTYPSIFVFLSAFSSLMFFSNIKVSKLPSFISKLAIGSFAAYIIHVHHSFWNHFIVGKFFEIASSNYAFIIFFIVILFVIISSLIDLIRIKLEKTIVNPIIKKISNKYHIE